MRMFEIDWLMLADWEKRGRLFGALSLVETGGHAAVGMDYRIRGAEWSRLRTLWLRLPSHPHLIEALAPFGDDGVKLRYTAIDWYGRSEVSPGRCASWTLQVADVFRTIVSEMREADLRQFGNPAIHIDIGGAARVAFRPPHPGSVGPRDERAFACLVGALLRSILPTPPAQMQRILDTCMHADPTKRYRSLAALEKACRDVVEMANPLRAGSGLAAWKHAECGIGFLAMNDAERAHGEFVAALRYDEYKGLARWGCDSALRRRQQTRGWYGAGSLA
jgi:hypothetical protein